MMNRLFPLLLATPLLAQNPKPSFDSLAKLDLPGVKINLEKKSVDVTAAVSLREGSLEFIACTPNSKEHESIVVVKAKPSHIHTALLLLRAKPGHPAIRKMVGDADNPRWIDLPPQGSPVTVSFVVPGKNGKPVELPISDFVARIDYDSDPKEAEIEGSAKRLQHFVFAGSHLYGKDGEPKTYLADTSGSVISLSTFGDELLCLPEVYANENQALQWEVNPKHLPEIGTEITLRLTPTPVKEEDSEESPSPGADN